MVVSPFLPEGLEICGQGEQSCILQFSIWSLVMQTPSSLLWPSLQATTLSSSSLHGVVTAKLWLQPGSSWPWALNIPKLSRLAR